MRCLVDYGGALLYAGTIGKHFGPAAQHPEVRPAYSTFPSPPNDYSLVLLFVLLMLRPESREQPYRHLIHQWHAGMAKSGTS